LASGKDRRRARRQADRGDTQRDYLWRLRGHLLPFFAPRRLDEIDAEHCLAFKAHKVREAADLRSAITARSEPPRSSREANRPARTVVDPQADRHACRRPHDAIEDGHIDRNPARGKRMCVRVPKPQRTFLELDELPALIDAQLEQRVKREHGVRFDAVVRDARVQLHGAQMSPEKATKRRRGRGAHRPGITTRDE
jgi:hypothetical protein